ncbi:MAG: hypothetical protein P8J87_09255 [Verrucomicrobiales bacterium]|nr:hypothetical protein [Verrucomicrobiales bacterium]
MLTLAALTTAAAVAHTFHIDGDSTSLGGSSKQITVGLETTAITRFQAGTPARADDVNGNFQALINNIDSHLNGRILELSLIDEGSGDPKRAHP